MSVPSGLTKLVGVWQGANTLHVPWLDPPQSQSSATAAVTPVVNGLFLTIAYTWSHEEERHEGLFVIGQDTKTGAVTAAWTDSWHQSGSVMFCSGSSESDGTVRFSGSYAAPPDPDWHWRTEISSHSADEFAVIMTNISPNGEETLAVETYYRRSGAPNG